MTSLPLPPEMCPKCGRAEVADLKFDVERLEKAVDVLAASVNAATIRAEKAEAEVAALRERRRPRHGRDGLGGVDAPAPGGGSMMPGPREVIEGVLRDCATLVADRPHAAGALARVLLGHLGRAGLLPDCPMTWDTEWLAHDDHHRCGSFEDHPGRCSCIVEGCRSWRSR